MGSYRASVGLQVRFSDQPSHGVIRRVGNRLHTVVAHPPMPIA
jgi:hypothetical protein